jgi:hypothetical protein
MQHISMKREEMKNQNDLDEPKLVLDRQDKIEN